MVLKVAAGYIDMGKTRVERENYLRSACSAWNIACLPTLKRESAIKQYIERCREINNSDSTDCKSLEGDLRLLIKQKNEPLPTSGGSTFAPAQLARKLASSSFLAQGAGAHPVASRLKIEGIAADYLL